MSVDPGFPGQKFVDGTEEKIVTLKSWIEKESLQVKIEVDGGIKEDNIRMIKQVGADYIVAGSAVFGSKNPGETVRKMVRWIGEQGDVE
jgi:ribulose-phosphate 3-epimerase